MSIFLHLYTRNILSQLLCVILQCTMVLGRGVKVNSITPKKINKGLGEEGREAAADSNKIHPLSGAQ